MGNKDSGFDRLMVGSVASNDPDLGHVATFLERVRQASPPAEITHLEAAHLARARVALSALGSPRALRRGRRVGWSRRLVVGSVVGVFGAMSAGIGVAMAMGVDPIEAVTHLSQIMVPNADPSTKPGQPTERPGVQPSPGTSEAHHENSEAEEHSRSVGDDDHPSPNPHSTYSDDAKESEKAVEASERASEKAAKESENAAEVSERASEKAAKESAEASEKAARESAEASEKAAKESAKASEMATKDEDH